MAIEDAAGVGTEKGLAEGGVLEKCETRETTMLQFLDWMDERWGDAGRQCDTCPGVYGWFIKEMGFDKSDCDKIKASLGVPGA